RVTFSHLRRRRHRLLPSTCSYNGNITPTTTTLGFLAIHPRQHPVGEITLPQHERQRAGHLVQRFRGHLCGVEQRLHKRRGLEPLADEEEDSDHVADLVPQERRAVQGEVVEFVGRVGALPWIGVCGVCDGGCGVEI